MTNYWYAPITCRLSTVIAPLLLLKATQTQWVQTIVFAMIVARDTELNYCLG